MEVTNGLRSATKEDILTALRTEAFTYARSMLFAAAARKNGRTEIADLFEATARTELEEHFATLADLAGIVGDDADNLRAAIEAESYEIEVMCDGPAGATAKPAAAAAATAASVLRCRRSVSSIDRAERSSAPGQVYTNPNPRSPRSGSPYAIPPKRRGHVRTRLRLARGWR